MNELYWVNSIFYDRKTLRLIFIDYKFGGCKSWFQKVDTTCGLKSRFKPRLNIYVKESVFSFICIDHHLIFALIFQFNSILYKI